MCSKTSLKVDHICRLISRENFENNVNQTKYNLYMWKKKMLNVYIYILIKALSFLIGHFLELTSSKYTWTCGKFITA